MDSVCGLLWDAALSQHNGGYWNLPLFSCKNCATSFPPADDAGASALVLWKGRAGETYNLRATANS